MKAMLANFLSQKISFDASKYLWKVPNANSKLGPTTNMGPTSQFL
jgi:hypothetical protein